MDTMEGTGSIGKVLGEVSYPAEKWQITTCADMRGVDLGTRRAFYSLPVRTYHTAAEVIALLDTEIDR